MKLAVVYWSGTGNTEAMAQCVAEGAKEAGLDVTLTESIDFSAAKVDEYDAIAFGCPSMGDEVLEEMDFDPMFTECEPKLKDKNIALFGSYGWGDGQWMRDWEERCQRIGVNFVCDYVICNEAPDDEAQAACKALGKAFAK